MVCAPCAEKARKRREALYNKIKEQNWLQEAPDEDVQPSNYHEEQTNSIYKKFKEKLHNAQALNNNKD